MKNLKKTLFRISAVVGVLFVLMVTISLVATRMIDTAVMRSRVQQEISDIAGVDIDFQRLSISFFPSPHLVVEQARVSMVEMFDGTFESLQIFPAIMPLFKGKIGLARIEIESPDFTMPFPAIAPPTEKKEERLSSSAIEEKVTSILFLLARNVPNIEVNNGTLKFMQEEKPVIVVGDLQVDIEYFSENFKFILSCNSNIAETISLKGSIFPDNLNSKGHIRLQQVQAQVLTDYFFPQEEYGLEDALVNVNLQFTADGIETFQAELQGSAPSLVIYRGDNQSVVKEVQLKGSLQATENGITATLGDFILGSPQLHLAGELTMDRKSSLVVVDLSGRDIPLQPLREAVLPLAGDIRVVKLFGDIVRGGNLDKVTLKAQGNSFSEVFTLENMHFAGRLSNGKIIVPDINIEIDSIKGEVELSDTILQFQNLRAKWGSTSVTSISAELTLQEDSILQVESGKANLDLETIYAKASTLEQFADTREGIESVKGNIAVSALSIEGPLLQPAQWRFAATGALKDVAIATPRVPGSITVSSGTIATDGEKLSLTDLQSTSQDSSINLTGSFNNYLQGFPEIDLTLSGTMGQETIQWLSELTDLPPEFKIRGPLTLTKVHIEMDPSDNILLQGKIAEHGGPVIEVDALKQGEDLTINKLLIQDENSYATIALLVKQDFFV